MDRRDITRTLLAGFGAAATTSAAVSATPASQPKVTPAERVAGVTPLDFNYMPGHFRRYGAVGDGRADDTGALNRAISVLNAGHGFLTGEPGDIYLCSPLDPVTAEGTFIDGRGTTLTVKADSWEDSPDGSTHLNLTGARSCVTNLTLDGNQAAFAHAPRAGRLLQFGNDTTLLNVTVKNSAAQGARTAARRALCVACRFDDNANVGMELDGAADLKFACCTWNCNGYGFRQSLQTNTFAAFGLSVRYRSHHLTFEGCEASQNGREGIAIGQGSYACKLIGCTAWMNGDGGFTIHSDRTSASTAGDHEACYDLEYIDCESYDNFASGLVAFATVHNVSVIGGRYYNNHRLAGSQPFASSFPNGLYFAAGSRGIVIATCAYDDRQLRVICSISGEGPTRTVQATGWITGSIQTYPKVALYSDNGDFQGYGLIDSESPGAVTLRTVPYDGVNLASIVAGWRITQRVQHNGCFLDNDCQGRLDIDGFGFLRGPRQYTGWRSLSGYFTNGQNVRLHNAITYPAHELVVNGSFDKNIANWIFASAAAGSATHHKGPKRRSAGALELRAGANEAVTADAALDKDALRAAADTFVEASAWCYAEGAGDGGLQLFWNPGSVTFHTTVEHPGGGWKCLAIGAFIPANATQLFPRLYTVAGKTCYFDNVSMHVKAEPCDGRDLSYPSRSLPL